jgi:hypothetical protein
MPYRLEERLQDGNYLRLTRARAEGEGEIAEW